MQKPETHSRDLYSITDGTAFLLVPEIKFFIMLEWVEKNEVVFCEFLHSFFVRLTFCRFDI